MVYSTLALNLQDRSVLPSFIRLSSMPLVSLTSEAASTAACMRFFSMASGVLDRRKESFRGGRVGVDAPGGSIGLL